MSSCGRDQHDRTGGIATDRQQPNISAWTALWESSLRWFPVLRKKKHIVIGSQSVIFRNLIGQSLVRTNLVAVDLPESLTKDLPHSYV